MSDMYAAQSQVADAKIEHNRKDVIMKKIDRFVNQYSLSKTLQFSLIPQGETEENFAKKVLEEDKQRAEDYKEVKKYIDRYHKVFIEEALSRPIFAHNDIEKYAAEYKKGNDKTATENKKT